MKKWITPNIIAVLVFFVLVLLLRNKETLYEGSYLVDAFSITGFFLVIISGMMYVNNNGVFDIIIYGTKKIWFFLRRKPEDFADSYFEFTEQRHDRSKVTLWPTIVVGFVYIVIGIIIYLAS